jgi:hypothetical protein
VAIRIKAVTILDTSATTPINRFTDVLGMSVDKLNVRVELEAATGTVPDEVPIEVRVLEPKHHRDEQSSMKDPPLKAKARRKAGTLTYTAGLALSSFGELMKAGDSLKEVATVVRDGGTSSALFRSLLVNGGWAMRGAAKQAAEGKADVTGDLGEEQPDARTLMLAGGVEVMEVRVPASSGFTVGPQATTWAFVRSPADVFFYSGHGGWWNCHLLREDATASPDFGWPRWLKPEDLLKDWQRQKDITTSPFDLDVLIINGCSVLGHHGNSTDAESDKGPKNRSACTFRWRELLTSEKGPLVAILGYRGTAPYDKDGGNDVALEMAQAMLDTLGSDWKAYARKWLQINAKRRQTWTAAAIEKEGFSYINLKEEPASHTHPALPLPGYDANKPEGAVIGPGPIPHF